MPRMRCWYKPEFDECKDADERDEVAWKVPDLESFMFPKRFSVVEDVDEAASTYAEYFYNERDGHCDSWPQDFVVHDTMTDSYFVVSVHLDYDPTFTCAKPEPYVWPTPTDPTPPKET